MSVFPRQGQNCQALKVPGCSSWHWKRWNESFHIREKRTSNLPAYVVKKPGSKVMDLTKDSLRLEREIRAYKVHTGLKREVING